MIIPFSDRFPQNTEIYRLLTTRPEDLKDEGRAYDRDTSGQVGPKPIPAVQEISKDQAVNFIHQCHYSKVMPRLNRFYLGFFIDGRLAGVVVLGWGTQPLQTIRKLFPCHVLRTTDYIEIGKMCFLPDFNDTQCFGSIVISQMVKWLKANTRYLYLYTLADGIMGKCGYVYQASNFQYVGSFTTSVYRDSLTGRKSTREAPGPAGRKCGL